MFYRKVVEGHLLSAKTTRELTILEELAGVKSDMPEEGSTVETFELELDTIPQGLYSHTRGSFDSNLELYQQLAQKISSIYLDSVDLVEKKK